MAKSREQKRIVQAVMSYYDWLVENGDPAAVWSPSRHKFSRKDADAFFVGVMLDYQQHADRAWDGGKHIVRQHFQEGAFWECVASTPLKKVEEIVRFGFDGKVYHRFWPRVAKALKGAADLIATQYAGDVRKVWAVRPSDDVDLIYERFKEFHGIGDALARMAQFILVRQYGVGGGEAQRQKLHVKPDVHLRRVTRRLGLVTARDACGVGDEIAALEIESPADFDLALFRTGQYFCRAQGPNCSDCHLENVCAKVGVS